MWLLPSRGRPHLAQRLFDAGDFKTPGLLILDIGDSQHYEDVKLPKDWEKIIRPRMYLSGKINAGFAYRPNEKWYGVLNDDHLPITPGWDVLLSEGIKGRPLVWPQDNYADRISVPVMDGEFARKLGWVACPDLNHFYLDDVNELIAECFGCERLDDVMVSHEHVNKGRMKPDRTYMERPSNARDRAAYAHWCEHKWPAIRELIGA
jgi:hypothetical protein